jgi:hypothetical protein
MEANMKIPSKVRISGVDYAVVRTRDPILVEHEECMGAVAYYEHVIRLKVDPGVDEQQSKETLLHEMFHAILSDREIDFEDEESIVEQLARAWYQIIADNPAMFAPGSKKGGKK